MQAAWSAIRTEGRLQARYRKLVRRLGGPKNPPAVKKVILAIARTLLKIAYQVLRSGKPYQDLGPTSAPGGSPLPAARGIIAAPFSRQSDFPSAAHVTPARSLADITGPVSLPRAWQGPVSYQESERLPGQGNVPGFLRTLARQEMQCEGGNLLAVILL